MGEKLSILKCKWNHIYYKSFCSGISKPSDQKKNSAMIQMHNEKTMLKKI
jgi:hypothetical protein